jgi:hypothetical protein
MLFLLSFFLMRALLCILYVLFHTLSLVRYLEEICHIPANSLSHPVMGIIGSERQQPGWDKARE